MTTTLFTVGVGNLQFTDTIDTYFFIGGVLTWETWPEMFWSHVTHVLVLQSELPGRASRHDRYHRVSCLGKMGCFALAVISFSKESVEIAPHPSWHSSSFCRLHRTL